MSFYDELMAIVVDCVQTVSFQYMFQYMQTCPCFVLMRPYEHVLRLTGKDVCLPLSRGITAAVPAEFLWELKQ